MAFNASPNYAGSYLGVRATNPPNFIQSNFRPGPNNWQNVVVGDLWLYIPDPTSSGNREIYMLVSLVGNTALWVPLSGSTGTLLGTVTDDLLIETPDPVLGLLSLAGDGNIVTSQGGSHEAMFSLAPSITVQSLNARNNTASANAPALVNLIKTRNNGPVNSGDDIGCINWLGYDTNSNPILTAQICTFATGVGVNQMGGIMRLYTTPVIPLTSPRQRIEIDQTGIVSINQADGDVLIFDTPTLFVAGSSVISSSISTTPAVGAFTTILRTHGPGAIQNGDEIGTIQFGGRDTNGNIIAAASIGTQCTGVVAPSQVPGTLAFSTHPASAFGAELATQRMTINPAGNVLINQADGDTFGGGSTVTFSVLGASVISDNDTLSTTGGLAQITKSRNQGVITAGDDLGTLAFVGYDTVPNPIEGAYIKSINSGTIGANRVAGDLRFGTHPDSNVAASDRMIISREGRVTVFPADAGVSFTVLGQISIGGNDTGTGTPFNVDITNVKATAGGGAGSITAQADGVGVTQAGWIKCYVNAVVSYIPYYQ